MARDRGVERHRAHKALTRRPRCAVCATGRGSSRRKEPRDLFHVTIFGMSTREIKDIPPGSPVPSFRVAIVPSEAATATRKLGLRDQLGMPLGDACARRTGRQPGAVHVKNSRQPGHALADDHVVGDVVGPNRRRIGADIRTPARSQDLIDG